MTGTGPKSPERFPEPALDIQVIPEDLEEKAVREGIHQRIQVEIHHENKEIEARAEEMLDIPLEWNEVPDLIMEEGGISPEDTRPEKRKRDEIARELRNQRREDHIQTEKQNHSPTVSQRIQNSEGFYSKDWDKGKQEEDEWQAPDKFQKNSQIVFRNGVLESHPRGDEVLSSPHVQHQGGGCSSLEEWVQNI